MKILLLNQTFHPDVAATAQHSYDLARYLAGAGHDVAVITSRSLYGKPGADLAGRETTAGTRIHRAGRSFFGKSHLVLRLADACVFWAAAAFQAMTIERPDVVISLTTPPFLAALAWAVKAFRGARFVYWVMDLYPDTPIACGLLAGDSRVARILEAWNRFCLRRADRVVVLGRCMKRRVLAKGVDPRSVEQIPVWSVDESAASADGTPNRYRQTWQLDGSFVVMYSGNVGLGHDTGTICAAAMRLRWRRDIRFVFAGGGKRRGEIEAFAARHGLENMFFYPYQPREQLGEMLRAGDLHLVSLLDAASGVMVPSKLYGVMAAARPVVFVGPPDSEIAYVIGESRCGTVVSCGDEHALVREIERLAADRTAAREMGRRAREALLERYSRELACAHWGELLRTLAPPAWEIAAGTTLPSR